MSDAFWIALFVAIPAIFSAGIAGFVTVYRLLKEIHTTTNSMSERLQMLAKAEGHAEGVKEEKSRRAESDLTFEKGKKEGAHSEEKKTLPVLVYILGWELMLLLSTKL